uniref:Uncharacterized protein n=1 Tax=Arundo donax TaxID=35708 RepID=A0A0A8ZQR8_ARUDO
MLFIKKVSVENKY